jgi:hypothetical protein
MVVGTQPSSWSKIHINSVPLLNKENKVCVC